MHRNTILISALVLSSSIAATAISRDASAGTIDTPVVGGTTVKPGAYPDVVAVLTSSGGLCTGTLLEADLVLTAGHCAADKPVRVIQGAVDLAKPWPNVRDVKFSRAYPAWETTFDVGIVMLENPLAAKPRSIAFGCSTRNHLVPGSMLEVVGFGLTTKAGVGDNTQMHQAKIAVTDGDCTNEPACAAAVAPGGEFVAGGNGTDACFGDSGGPVFINTANGPGLIGVVSRGIASYGEPCGDGGIYVRADRVADWIETVSGRIIHRMTCATPADDGASNVDGDDQAGGCNAGGEAVGGVLILVVLTLLWLMTWNRARKAR